MSGTSLDGLDVAFCCFRGCGLATSVKVLNFETVPYSQALKETLALVAFKRQVELQMFHAKLGRLYGKMVDALLKKWGVSPQEVACIASHGQTVYHAPHRLHSLEENLNAILQIGDGDHLALEKGIPTLSDFRQKEVAAGGEGAPLALYGDFILFPYPEENRILLNIGGIANFTYLPSSQEDVICTDLGPGNTLCDQLVREYDPALAFDKGGDFARQGKAHPKLLARLLGHPFFQEPFPKTTGPELFNLDFMHKAQKGLENPSFHDLCATAALLTAEAAARGIHQCLGRKKGVVYLSGGGAHNLFMKEKVQELLPELIFKDLKVLGVDPDAKEAALFALLANETICGSKLPIGRNVTRKISLPA